MKKYLSLYKTSSEHSADQSRLIPNISLITDDKKLILTNENNIGTIFEPVDIIESFDDIINRFPTGNSTGMPGLKIYGDNTDQSKAKNIKLFNDAIDRGFDSNDGQWDDFYLHVDAVLIDNIIMDKYDGNYNYYIRVYQLFTSGTIKYYIDIYKNITSSITYNNEKILTISKDGSVQFLFNKFPSPLETAMPGLNIYTDNTDKSKEKNIKLFNAALQWRKDYILYNGLSDTGQPIKINVDGLIIGNKTIDKYDRHFNYYINIYNNRITLANYSDDLEILAISSDGSVDVYIPEYITPTPTTTR